MHPRSLRLASFGLLIGGLFTLLLIPGAYTGYGRWAALDVALGSLAFSFIPGIYLLLASRAGGPAATQGTPSLGVICGATLLAVGSLLGSTQLAALPGAHGFWALLTVVEDTALPLVWGILPGAYLVSRSPALKVGTVLTPPPSAIIVSPSSNSTSAPVLTLVACPECHAPMSTQLSDGQEFRCPVCKGRVGNSGGRPWSVPG